MAVKIKKLFLSQYGVVEAFRPNSNGHEHLLVVPGYSETLVHTKPLARELGAVGFDALASTWPRRGGVTVTEPIARQAVMILNVLNVALPDGDPATVVAHSLGAVAALRAAQDHPERIDRLVLFEPIGLSGRQSLLELALRATVKTVRNYARGARAGKVGLVTAATLASARALASNPLLAVREARAASRYDLAEDLATVHARGIPVHIVTSDVDEMVNNATQHARLDHGLLGITSHHRITATQPGHDAPWLYPQTTARITRRIIGQRRHRRTNCGVTRSEHTSPH